MVPPIDDDNKLQIRCPGCGQRFKVLPEFRNRMVECGVCEHRFHIRDDVIVRIKKFYPGEKRHHGLNRFQRVPHAQSVGDPLTASAVYEEATPAVFFEPVPPQRIIAGLIGVIAMLIVAILLIFGSDHGGPLDGMEVYHKLIMSGFTAVLGLVLLLYANPQTRLAAATFGGVFAAALISLPFFFTGESGSRDEFASIANAAPEADEAPRELTPEEEIIERMRERVGLRPLDQEIERLAETENELNAYGLVLIGLQESNRIAVRDYMFRVASPDPTSHIYPRDEEMYLFVLTGLGINIERLASLAAPLGKVRLIVPELNIIEIAVDNAVFIESPSDKIINREDPEFYELNLRELNSIDIQRIERAVARLAEAEPRMFRADITRRLRELLTESGVYFHDSVARALSTWDEDQAGVSEIATQTAIHLKQRGSTPPTELISLAIQQPSEDLVPVIVALWRDNTLLWENYCIKLGPMIEQAMMHEFEIGEGSRRQSAVRILSKIGGEESGRKLHAALDDANRELSVIINQALESIAKRIDAEE